MPHKLPQNVLAVFRNFVFLTHADPGEKYYLSLTSLIRVPEVGPLQGSGFGGVTKLILTSQNKCKPIPKTKSILINQNRCKTIFFVSKLGFQNNSQVYAKTLYLILV